MRKLLWHEETESLFELFNQEEIELFIEAGKCKDVTGDRDFERMFVEVKTRKAYRHN